MLKRKIAGLAAVTVMTLSSIAPSMASEGQVGGSVNLDELDERNPASVVSVGGGTWEYGVGPINVYSYYQHHAKNHSATVRGLKEVKDTQPPGIQARARTIKNPAGGNTANWNAW